MRKKRTFLLIEVMMAIAILAIALPPLIKGFHQIYLSKVKRYESIGMELMAREAFCDLKAKLYSKEGKKWDFQKKVKEELPPISCQLPGLAGKTFHLSFISTPVEKYKKKNGNSRFLLCKVEILVENEKERASFAYPLFLIQEITS